MQIVIQRLVRALEAAGFIQTSALEQNMGRHSSADIVSLMIQRNASGLVVASVDGKWSKSRAWSINSHHSVTCPVEDGQQSILQPPRAAIPAIEIYSADS